MFSAFSIFAFVEYFVAAANMYYYWSIATDLPDEEIVVLQPVSRPTTSSRRCELSHDRNATETSNGYARGANESLEAKKDR